LVVGIAVLGSALISGLAVWNLKPSPLSAPQSVARLTVTIPADEELVSNRPVAMSPNGLHLVYVARRGGVQRLHLRSIASLESKALVGTEGASAPFFSPDSQWLGFFAEGKLKKIPVSGGASEIVCDAPASLGGSWAPNDVIYFERGGGSGLWQVSVAGGAPQPFTTLQGGEISHRWPQVLPGGQAVLFTSRTGPGSDERQVQVQHVSSGERRTLVRGDTGAYVPTGHLVYVQTATGTLVAVPFDLTRLQVGATAPVAVAEGILGPEGAHYTSSDNGLLAYVVGPSDFAARTLVWVDRNGKADPLEAPGRPYEAPQLSPDGSQVAVMTRGTKMDIWVYNLVRGDATKLISDGSDQFPIWTPDGKRLTYRATRAGTRNIFWRMADGSGSEERLTTGEGTHTPGSWLPPDGQILLFMEATADRNVLALRLIDRKTRPFLQTRFLEGAPRFSPDGHWVAYVSNESGPQEIYVKPYPGPGGKQKISIDGGTEPLWNPNGRELFYRSGNKMMAVNIVTQPVVTAGKPTELFTGDYMPASATISNYDVSRDGRRFLMIQPTARENATPTQIIVVLNWLEELKRLVPTR
jgi:serine/threonine-protein kinase